MEMKFFRKKPDTFDYQESRTCKVCNHVFTGRYCNICGEKITEPYEKSFLNFLDSLLNAFTFLDGKFLKSIHLLLTKPGQLSRNIADGKRVPYMKMVNLFFVANFFYFLFPTYDSFNSSLYTQMNLMGQHSETVTRIVEERMTADQIGLEEFRIIYQRESGNLSKLFLVLLVVVFSLALSMINYSEKIFYFDHLLFSFELYSFNIMFIILVLGWLAVSIFGLARAFGLDWSIIISDRYFSLVAYSFLMYFLIRGQMNFYGQRWYWVIPKSVLLFFVLDYSIQYYRILLFYVTMWSIK